MDTERLTNEQKNFLDAIKVLLDLYCLVKEIDKTVSVHEHYNIELTRENMRLNMDNTDVFFIEPVIKLMAELFHKTIPNFSPCIFFRNPNFFHYRMAKETIAFQRPIARSHAFDDFIRTMDSLREGITNNMHDFFVITEATRESRSHKKTKFLTHLDSFEKSNTHGNYVRDYEWIDFDDPKANLYKLAYVQGDVDCQIRPPKHKSGDNDYSKEMNSDQYQSLNTDLNLPPPYHEIFTVRYRPVLHLFEPFHGQLYDWGALSSPGYLKEDTEFFDVIKYILVKYVSLFGSFKRVKVCKYCGKLTLEIKTDHKVFCNLKCRNNFNVESENEDIFRCRNRQNRWAERNLTQGFSLCKEECQNCRNQPIGKKEPKGGKCQNILIKNQDRLPQ